MVRMPCAFARRAAALAGVEARSAPARSRAPWPRACRRRAFGSCPRSRCRWPGRSAASCRSASGRPRARGRSPAQPSIRSQPCQFGRAPRVLMNCRLASSTSRASVDLPEPLTPVTATRRFSGRSTVTSCRLCRVAPRIVSSGLVALSVRSVAAVTGATLRRGCTGCSSGRASTRPVTESGCDEISAALPSATSRPPRLPAPGPMSMMWSARADRLLVVLDHDQRVALVAQILERAEQDARCRANAGRSSARRARSSTPCRLLPSCAASRMRCASPPESVGAARSSVR